MAGEYGNGTKLYVVAGLKLRMQSYGLCGEAKLNCAATISLGHLG